MRFGTLRVASKQKSCRRVTVVLGSCGPDPMPDPVQTLYCQPGAGGAGAICIGGCNSSFLSMQTTNISVDIALDALGLKPFDCANI